MPSHRVLSAAPALLARPLPCFAIPHRPVAGMSVSLFSYQTSGLTDWNLSSALRSVVSAWLSALRGSHYTHSQLGVQIRYGTTPRNPLQTLASLGVSKPTKHDTKTARHDTTQHTTRSQTRRHRHSHDIEAHHHVTTHRRIGHVTTTSPSHSGDATTPTTHSRHAHTQATTHRYMHTRVPRPPT